MRRPHTTIRKYAIRSKCPQYSRKSTINRLFRFTLRLVNHVTPSYGYKEKIFYGHVLRGLLNSIVNSFTNYCYRLMNFSRSTICPLFICTRVVELSQGSANVLVSGSANVNMLTSCFAIYYYLYHCSACIIFRLQM